MLIKLTEKFILCLSRGGIFLLSAAAIALLLIIFKEEGLIGVWTTLRVDVLGVLSKFMVMLVIFFTITGAVNHLHKRHPEKFREIVSGKYGTVAMVALAAVMPGPAGGKQLQEAWSMPGVSKADLLLCLTAMMGASIIMFMFRSAFIGPILTLVWVGLISGLLIEVWLIGKAWERFYS